MSIVDYGREVGADVAYRLRWIGRGTIRGLRNAAIWVWTTIVNFSILMFLVLFAAGVMAAISDFNKEEKPALCNMLGMNNGSTLSSAPTHADPPPGVPPVRDPPVRKFR